MILKWLLGLLGGPFVDFYLIPGKLLLGLGFA